MKRVYFEVFCSHFIYTCIFLQNLYTKQAALRYNQTEGGGGGGVECWTWD